MIAFCTLRYSGAPVPDFIGTEILHYVQDDKSVKLLERRQKIIQSLTAVGDSSRMTVVRGSLKGFQALSFLNAVKNPHIF